MARVLLDEGLADLEYLETLDQLAASTWPTASPAAEPTFAAFVAALQASTTRSSRRSSRRRRAACRRRQIVEVARLIGAARGAFASHVWRGSGQRQPGRLAGRARAAVPDRAHRQRGHAGRHLAPRLEQVQARRSGRSRRGQKEWNELLFPHEWPLSHYEMSFLLPHFLKEGRGKLDTYFTRVYNPVWTNPDGMTWMEVLQDESLVGLHAALTPDLERDRGLRRLRAARWATAASATTSRARRRSPAAG